tara:strand:- start:214 stop:795 length:582 start_codon:yes stop_codon:yes gene_type:complete
MSNLVVKAGERIDSPDDSPVVIDIETDIPNIKKLVNTYNLERINSPKIHSSRKHRVYSRFFGYMFLILLAIGIIGGVISYLTFGIKFLVEDKEINDSCHSNIWSFVLTMIIISFITGGSTSKAKDDDIRSITCIFTGLINLGLGIWGIVEFTNTTCEPLVNSNIYIWSQVSSIFSTILGSIYLIVGVLTSICK